MQTSTEPVQESAAWEILPSSSSQIRYGSVDWSFDSKLSSVKPPHYHGSLLRTSRPSRRYVVIWNAKPYGSSQHPTTLPHNSAEEWAHSDSLNHQFIAVKLAEDVLQPYELDVGFSHSIMPDLAMDKSYFSSMRLSADVEEEEVQFGRSQWAALARDLIGDTHLSMGASIPEVSRPQSALSSLEYDSEPSTDSDIPRTPTQKGAFPDIEVHQHSPVLNIRGLPPSKALNGSARTFTPKSRPPSKHSYPLISSSPDSTLSPGLGSSPTPVNFAFPAINGNYQYLPQVLKKDDQGFYTSVTPSSSPSRARLESRLSSTRLPHFLSDAQPRSRKASRTRVIVDQMKATPLPSKKGRPQNHSQSPSREVDSPLSPETSSPSGAGDTTNSGSTDSEDQDPGATFTDTRITARNSGWKELSSVPAQSVKAQFPASSSTTAGVSFHATYPTVPFVVQAPVPPFYPTPRASGYSYSCIPPPTSWVPITVPAYPSGVYTRPVMAHAAW